MFGPLRAHAPAFGSAWPAAADLQSALDARMPPVRNARGAPLRVVPPGPRRGGPGGKYEARVFVEGELPVRAGDWHDCFNVLVWLAFPRAKAALNARHYAELERRRGTRALNRGPVQDALTLFDEGGVIVASADAGLARLLLDWRWKALFWERRAELSRRVRFFLFGHALYEKALDPFLGMTARGLVLEVPAEVLDAPPAEQLAEVDRRAADRIADPLDFRTTRELAVVPILGVPGWFPGNDREDFYDNTDYFRPRRQRDGG
jgi:hypothetical protein